MVLSILALTMMVFLWRYLNAYLKKPKAGGTSITLSLIPASLSFKTGEVKEIQLIAQFKDGSASEKIDYFKLKINFPKDNLELVDAPTIDPNSLNLSLVRVIQVDGPATANTKGIVIIELGSSLPDSGPATNSRPIVAKIKFKGKSAIKNSTISVDKDLQIINNASSAITQITKNNTTFSVTDSGRNNTPTPTRITPPRKLLTSTPKPSIMTSCTETDCTKIKEKLGKGCSTKDYLLCLKKLTPIP